MDTIDINVDLGEGATNDALLMPLISSCNIACGGHYGNLDTIRRTIKLAQEHNVKIGAHPSYPDKLNFGRKVLKLSPKELKISLDTQLQMMIQACESLNAPLHHIKPHGALYNFAATDSRTAEIFIASILDTKLRPVLYAPKQSILYEKAKNYLPVAFEAFIDRRYTDDLQLVDRTEDNAVINTPVDAWQQLYAMLTSQQVQTCTGKIAPIEAQTYCLHSDNPQALEILTYIHLQINQLKIRLY